MERSRAAATGRPADFVAWLVGERIVRGAASAVALAVVARHLAPAGFGELNFALAIIGNAMPLAQFGFDTIVVRELVRRPELAPDLLGTATALRLLFGLLCAVALLAAVATVPALAPAWPALGPLTLTLIVQAVETPDLWFRAQVQSKPLAVARTTAVVAGAVGKCGLAFAGAGVLAFAWLTLAEVVAFEFLLWAFYARREPRRRWRWNSGVARSLIREAALLAAATTLGGIAFRVDQWYVAVRLGEAPAGMYFAALRLIEIPTFVAASTAAAVFPLLAANNPAGRPERVTAAFGLLAAIGWVTAIGTTLLGPPILRLVAGSEYEAAGTALILRGWAMLPFFTGMIRTHLAMLARSGGTQLAVVSGGLVMQLALNAWLVPRFGLTGAALAFLGTELVSAWVVPLLLPVLRPHLRQQWTAWGQPWRPSMWPVFWRMLSAPRG